MIIYKRKRSTGERSILRRKLSLPKSTWARYIINIAASLFALIILFIIMNEIVMPAITRHGAEFPLTNIVGMTVVEAEPILRQGDLRLEITSEEYHPDKPTGTILSQFPVGGTMVKSGRTIKVVTSLGQKAVEVPDLRGFSIRQARLKLEAAGFTLGDVEWTLADSLPEKVVVFSYPQAGTKIPYGSDVNLMVNRGPYQQTVFVPRLIGLSLDEATLRLEEKGLKVGLVTRIIDENYLPETVMEQSEDAGSELLPGEEVDLVISSTD
jgi:beta-lactam-binding protein with PASTA domain